MPDSGPPGTEVIRSPDNRIVKLVRSLRQRKPREAERAFVVEGVRAVLDAVAAGARPRAILVRLGEPVPVELQAAGFPPARRVEPRLFDGLSDTVTPQGLLAVFPFPDRPVPTVKAPLVLLLDRIRDPGNLGTLLRTAAGAGVTVVYLAEGCVDPFNPKVVRAGMGAHFRVPIRELTPADIDEIAVACPLRVVAEADARRPYDAVDWTQPAALILGSEAEGVSPELRSLGTASVGIPLAGGVESLNAAIAGGVMLFEANRQRRRGPARGARTKSGAGAEG